MCEGRCRFVLGVILTTLLPATGTAVADDASARSGHSQHTALSIPVSSLSPEQRLDFSVGRGFFRRPWVTAPASTRAADGLGPLYNARGCINCHPNNGRGRPVDAAGDAAVPLLLRLDVPPQNAIQQRQLAEYRINNIAEPTYGLQLQVFATPGLRAEARITVSYEPIDVALADGSRVTLFDPDYAVHDLAYGPFHPQARLSPRVAPPMIGLGLLEAIDEQDILDNEDPGDSDGDGISGRANRVWDPVSQSLVSGRFGYKAGMPNLGQQVQAAFSVDLGLSVPLYPEAAGDCTERQPRCLAAPDGNSPQYGDLEVHQQVVDLVTSYLSHLAVPARRNVDAPDVVAGERVFRRIGCPKCHTPSYRTGSGSGSPVNHPRQIAPYTDLLLHDMGEGLADSRPEGLANGREWRTAPLWGIGLTRQVGGQRSFLHDGRARSLLEAILWHGGEAQVQRDAVVALDRRSRQQLLAFIESL